MQRVQLSAVQCVLLEWCGVNAAIWGMRRGGGIGPAEGAAVAVLLLGRGCMICMYECMIPGFVVEGRS